MGQNCNIIQRSRKRNTERKTLVTLKLKSFKQILQNGEIKLELKNKSNKEIN